MQINMRHKQLSVCKTQKRFMHDSVMPLMTLGDVNLSAQRNEPETKQFKKRSGLILAASEPIRLVLLNTRLIASCDKPITF